MRLVRSDRDLVSLTVLALLMTGPRHTYEMHRLMVDTHKDFVTGLPRSMYHAVARLEKAGLIRPVETSREGSRPERTVYALSDAGRVAVKERVRRLLECPDPDTALFEAALSFMGCLEPAEATAALRARKAELEAAVERIDGSLRSTKETGLPRLLTVEVEYHRSRLTAEITFVDELVGDLDQGRLTWPADPAQLEIPTAAQDEEDNRG